MSKQESLKQRLSKLSKKLIGAKPHLARIIREQIKEVHKELDALLAKPIPAHEFFQAADSKYYGSAKAGIEKEQRERREAYE